MDAKEYLFRYLIINRRIDRRIEELARFREIATGISAPTKFEKNGSHSDRVGNAVERIDELERKLNDDIIQLSEMRDDIERVISLVEEENAREVLEMRYINRYSWKKIAEKMHYAEKYVTGPLHCRALRAVEKILDERG